MRRDGRRQPPARMRRLQRSCVQRVRSGGSRESHDLPGVHADRVCRLRFVVSRQRRDVADTRRKCGHRYNFYFVRCFLKAHGVLIGPPETEAETGGLGSGPSRSTFDGRNMAQKTGDAEKTRPREAPTPKPRRMPPRGSRRPAAGQRLHFSPARSYGGAWRAKPLRTARACRPAPRAPCRPVRAGAALTPHMTRPARPRRQTPARTRTPPA